jgi:phytoene desaturase
MDAVPDRPFRTLSGRMMPPQAGAAPRKIAIIGAGPGGLAAAMLLSRAGAEVTVFERHARLGGRSATIEAKAGAGSFHFDLGPTFFLYPRVLEDIFAQCGRDLADEVELIKLDPQYDLVFEAGGRISASPDIGRLQAAVAALAPDDAAALPRFMADNRAKLAAFKPILESPFGSLRDLVSPHMLRSLKLMRPHRSVDSDLATYFKDERVRLAFSFQSKYLGMSPFRCPSLFTILSFMEYEYGVYHPRGGCGAVMAAMGRVARAQGVAFRMSTPVEEVLLAKTKGGKSRARGVRTASGEEAFDAVVVNADFAHAMTNLVPDKARRRWTDKKLAGKTFSCSTFMMYLGLRGTLDGLAHHTIYLSEDYRGNVADIEAGRAPAQPSFYVQNACVTDPALAPPGHSTLYVLVPVGNLDKNAADWPAIRDQYRAATLKRLERIGIKDIESRIVFEKIMTPEDWAGDMAIHHGATFNLSHSLDQMLCFRPHNRFEDLERMYLVGGGTHPGSGLPVIFESARITSRLLAQDLDLPGDWPETELAMAGNVAQEVAELA